MTEVTTLSERKTDLGSKLLYHGTSGAHKDELMAEYGLVANKLTLTPNLELALDEEYAGRGPRGLLTFWYPKRKEVELISIDATKPTVSLAPETKEEMLAKIADSDMDQWYKDAYARTVQHATTILPSSRLGAIARLNSGQAIELYMHVPSYTHRKNFLQDYVEEPQKMVEEVRKILSDTDITFFDGSLNVQRLAEDIVKTDLEHYLLSIGRSLPMEMSSAQRDPSGKRQVEKEWAARVQELQDASFKEPVYERYKGMLITKISGLLQKLNSYL